MEPCLVADCERPAAPKKGGMCEAHAKRRLRGAPLAAAVRIRGRPLEALREAALEYADADAEDDDAWRRAEARLMRAAMAYSRERALEAARAALAAARAAGVRVGRPRKVTHLVALQALQDTGSMGAAAALLMVDRRTVARAVRRA